MASEAWVTLATNDSYALGVLVLARSLRDVASTRPLVVMITSQVSSSMRSLLQEECGKVVEVQIIDSEDAAHLALLARPELGITLTKIHCWTLTEYTKCVFLDADTLVVQNCDDLFDREELSAAPDAGWPDCFNSGVFVFTPSQETYAGLVALATSEGSFDGGDQGLLNMYFSDWATREDNTRRLPFIYNMTSSASYFYRPAYKQYGNQVKIVHFIGSPKPWQQPSDWSAVATGPSANALAGLWWALFTAYVQPRLSSAMLKHFAPAVVESPASEASAPGQTGQAASESNRSHSSKEQSLPPYPYPHSIPIRQGLPENLPEKTIEVAPSLSSAEEPTTTPSPLTLQGESVGVAAHLVEASAGEASAGGNVSTHHHSHHEEGPQLSSEEVTALRRQAWERGEIDYKGQDSFDNILEKMKKTILESKK